MTLKQILEVLVNQHKSPLDTDKEIAHAQAEIMKCVPEEVVANLYANKGFEKLNNYKNGWNTCREEMLRRLI